MKLNLSHIKPCDQQWENMTPNEQGRLCQKCNKTIIDFTKKSNREIAEIHTFSEEAVCGMYLPRQLRLDGQNSSFPRSSTLKPFLLSFFGLLTTSSGAVTDIVYADQFQEPVSQLNGNINWSQTEVIDSVQPIRDSLIVYGVVRDSEGEPVIFAPVYIEGTKIGTQTNYNGEYELEIYPFLKDSNEIALVFSYLGYQSQKIILYKKHSESSNRKELDVTLNEEIRVISFSVRRPPWYKRVWYKVKNVFRSKR